MPYEPTWGVYRYIDEETNFPHQTSGHRAKQVLPRKDYNPAEIARQARHQAREEVRQRNRRPNTGIQPDEDELYGSEDVHQLTPQSAIQWQSMRTHSNGTNGVNVYNGSPPPAPYPYHAIPPRRTAQYQQQPQQQPYGENDELETERTVKRKRSGLHLHWFVVLGIGMVIALALVVVGNAIASWWTIHQDDTTYGRPRTFKIDAVVGHNDSSSNPSYFEAINLNRHVIVIELPRGDPTKARIYPVTTLFGDGQDLTPVTLSFKDVDGDGLIDMEIHIENQTIVMINDNGSFRPLKAGEKVHL